MNAQRKYGGVEVIRIDNSIIHRLYKYQQDIWDAAAKRHPPPEEPFPFSVIPMPDFNAAKETQ